MERWPNEKNRYLVEITQGDCATEHVNDKLIARFDTYEEAREFAQDHIDRLGHQVTITERINESK